MFSFLYRAFYDRTLFSFYVEKGKGYGIKLLFILALFSAFCFAIRLFVLFASVPPYLIEEFVSRMPEISVKNGIIILPRDHNYTYVSEDRRVFFVFDTTKEPVNLKDLPTTGVYVTTDSVLTVRHNEMRRIPLVKMLKRTDLNLDQNGMRQVINRVVSLSKIFVPPVMFIFGFPGIFVSSCSMVLLAFVLSFMMSRIIDVPLDKKQRARLAVLSVVPLGVINAAGVLLNTDIQTEWLSLSIILIYMFCFLKDGQKSVEPHTRY